MMTILVTVTDDNRDWYLDGVGHGFLHVDWHMLFNMDGVGPVYWHFYGERHWFLYWVGNVLLDGVWRWYMHLYWVRHGFLNMYGHWAVDVDLDGVGHGLFNWVGYGFLYRVGHRLRNMYGVGPVDWDLNGNMYFLNYWVGSGHMDWYLHWVGDFLFNWVRCWYWYLYWIRDFLFYWVRSWHVHFDGDWSIDWNMNWVRDFLFNWVRLRDVYGHFDEFLDSIWDMFDNRVRLRYWHLDGHRYVFFNWVGNMFLYWVGYWDIFDDSNGFVHLFVTVTAVTAVTAVATSEATA